jgi:hypothetical protein
MAKHEYSAPEALGLLLDLIERKSPALANEVRASIDAGKDVEESEPRRGRRKKARRYRKSVRLSDEEAVQAAAKVLEAYFVEQPLFISSTHASFREVGLAPQEVGIWRKLRDDSSDVERVGDLKAIAIDLRLETQITATSEQVWVLKPHSDDDVLLQQRNLEKLRTLLRFEG